MISNSRIVVVGGLVDVKRDRSVGSWVELVWMFERAPRKVVISGDGLHFGMRWLVQHKGDFGFDMMPVLQGNDTGEAIMKREIDGAKFNKSRVQIHSGVSGQLDRVIPERR